MYLDKLSILTIIRDLKNTMLKDPLGFRGFGFRAWADLLADTESPAAKRGFGFRV